MDTYHQETGLEKGWVEQFMGLPRLTYNLTHVVAPEMTR